MRDFARRRFDQAEKTDVDRQQRSTWPNAYVDVLIIAKYGPPPSSLSRPTEHAEQRSDYLETSDFKSFFLPGRTALHGS